MINKPINNRRLKAFLCFAKKLERSLRFKYDQKILNFNYELQNVIQLEENIQLYTIFQFIFTRERFLWPPHSFDPKRTKGIKGPNEPGK